MKSPAKSKPKQRTNWKQRALDCEEVIKIQNEIEKFHAENAEKYRARAESAEKHNALLLEEREKWNTPVIVRDLDTWPAGFVQVGVPDCCKESLCRGGAMEESWKRLKAWAKGIRQRKPKEVTTRL